MNISALMVRKSRNIYVQSMMMKVFRIYIYMYTCVCVCVYYLVYMSVH